MQEYSSKISQNIVDKFSKIAKKNQQKSKRTTFNQRTNKKMRGNARGNNRYDKGTNKA